jgi:hypothetical protein
LLGEIALNHHKNSHFFTTFPELPEAMLPICAAAQRAGPWLVRWLGGDCMGFSYEKNGISWDFMVFFGEFHY